MVQTNLALVFPLLFESSKVTEKKKKTTRNKIFHFKISKNSFKKSLGPMWIPFSVILNNNVKAYKLNSYQHCLDAQCNAYSTYVKKNKSFSEDVIIQWDRVVSTQLIVTLTGMPHHAAFLGAQYIFSLCSCCFYNGLPFPVHLSRLYSGSTSWIYTSFCMKWVPSMPPFSSFLEFTFLHISYIFWSLHCTK